MTARPFPTSSCAARSRGKSSSSYLKQHVLGAYFAVNASAKEFPVLQRLIRHKKDLAGKEIQLQDPTFAIKGFL